jgi:ABC-2 type transport system ATP-binding protein
MIEQADSLSSAATRVTIDDLVVRFQRFTLGPIELRIHVGEIFCLVGPNGAGKTTLISALLGLLPITSGRACLDGIATRGRPPKVLRQIGYVADDTGDIIPELTAWEFWELHAMAHARIVGSVESMLDRCAELSEQLDFVPPATPMSTYSYGMRKKAQLVAGLLHDPKVLVLDEPRNGLDPIAMERLDSLLRDARQLGTSIILATHDLRFAGRMADQVGILSKGRLIAQGRPSSLQRGDEPDFVQSFFRILRDA